MLFRPLPSLVGRDGDAPDPPAFFQDPYPVVEAAAGLAQARIAGKLVRPDASAAERLGEGHHLALFEHLAPRPAGHAISLREGSRRALNCKEKRGQRSDGEKAHAVFLGPHE